MELRFDKKCNSVCRHCGPRYSSKWQELADNVDSDIFNLYGRRLNLSVPREIVDEISKMAETCKMFMIAGGEPLIQDQHWQFLKNLKGKESDIELHYSTNLSTLEYHDENVLDYWKNYKQVVIKVSIDADPSIYTYARHKSLNISKLEQNIRKIQNYDFNNILVGTFTLHLFNITHLLDMILYSIKLGVLFHMSYVQHPDCISIQVLPNHLKEQLTKNLNSLVKNIDNVKEWEINPVWKNHPLYRERNKNAIIHSINDIIKFMNGADRYLEQYDATKTYIDDTDKMFKTSLESVFPEYKDMWK